MTASTERKISLIGDPGYERQAPAEELFLRPGGPEGRGE